MSQMRQKETLAFTPTLDLHRRSAASLGKAALVVLTEGAAPIDISGAYLRAVEDHQLADADDDLDRFLRNAKAPQIITVDVPEANDRTDYVLESAFWLNAQALGFPVQFDLKHLGQDMREDWYFDCLQYDDIFKRSPSWPSLCRPNPTAIGQRTSVFSVRAGRDDGWGGPRHSDRDGRGAERDGGRLDLLHERAHASGLELGRSRLALKGVDVGLSIALLEKGGAHLARYSEPA